MKNQNEHINSICTLLERLVGNVTSKNLFTGHGVFHKKDIMFGIWINQTFHLRAEDALADTLVNLECKPFTERKGHSSMPLTQYYALSERVLEDAELCKTLVQMSIKQIIEKKEERRLARLSRV